MATARRKSRPKPPPRSGTGVELDPIDGRPVFSEGMSRRRWLDATKADRKAAFIAELKTVPDEVAE